MACGIEKMTDTFSDEVTAGLATAADQEYEVSQGISFVGLNALLMRRYMHEYGITKDSLRRSPSTRTATASTTRMPCSAAPFPSQPTPGPA